MEGCKRGNPCNESRECGWYNDNWTNVTFEECEEQAQNLNSFAFSYGISGTEVAHMVMIHSTICMVCNEVEFHTRRTSLDPLQSFGIYRGSKKGTFRVICYHIIVGHLPTNKSRFDQ